MTIQVDDFHPTLRAAIAEAKAAGLEDIAARLEQRAFSASTTSSELLGEIGAAIVAFQDAAGDAMPPRVAANLERCLAEIRKVWPGF